MNNQIDQVIKNLREMRLPVMADELVNMNMDGNLYELSTLEVLDRITSNELISRKNNTINRYIKNSKLPQANASLNEIDYAPERKINKSVVLQLSTNEYIQKHRNVIIMGACGTGKSYIANALGINACNDLYHVAYRRMFQMTEELTTAHLNGDSDKVIKKLIAPDLLIVDDFLISSLNEKETLSVFKIVELRHGLGSTIVCSQLEPKDWHKRLGGGELADAILDRIQPAAYKLTLYGESYRKTKSK